MKCKVCDGTGVLKHGPCGACMYGVDIVSIAKRNSSHAWERVKSPARDWDGSIIEDVKDD